MESLEVFVPSRSRFVRSLTLEAVVGHWENVALVVPTAQVKQYAAMAKRYGVRLLGCPHDGIARTRQWIGQQAKNHFVMMDDDLRFYRRASQEDWHLHKFNKVDMQGMLTFIDRLLETYAHVGVGARQANKDLGTHYWPGKECARPLRVLAYRKKEFLECVHGRVAIMEDFDITMQLLRRGFANFVLTQYVQDQAQTQMPGGCSDYRTHELHNANVQKFVKLHAPFAKLREKENKTGGAFGKRLEATIYWQKTWEAAVEEVM